MPLVVEIEMSRRLGNQTSKASNHPEHYFFKDMKNRWLLMKRGNKCPWEVFDGVIKYLSKHHLGRNLCQPYAHAYDNGIGDIQVVVRKDGEGDMTFHTCLTAGLLQNHYGISVSQTIYFGEIGWELCWMKFKQELEEGRKPRSCAAFSLPSPLP